MSNMILRTNLAETTHRPWPLPSQPWVMRQTWHDLLFAHWPIAVETLRALVPLPLEIDTFDGVGWVGVIPFRMSHVRPRYVPALPWLSAFPELNVRTYVRGPNPGDPKPGVYFFSLDAANPLAVAGARLGFRLPYYRAAMRLQETNGTIHYSSTRTHAGAPPAQFVARYGPTGGVYHSRDGSLEAWLTERYCLYTVDGQQRAYRAEIQHVRWPLQPASAVIETNTMAAAAGIELPAVAPLLHFARRLDMVNWLLQPVEPHV